MTAAPGVRFSAREWTILLLVALALAGFATLWGPITTPLIDPFHEGEYLSTRMLLEPGAAAPLLIHGGMDYVPANLAAILFGKDHLIAGTRLFNLLFAFAASFAFLGALLTLARTRSEALVALLIGMLVLFWVNERAQGIVALQQASPSTRDFPLILGLWLLIAAVHRSDRWSDRLAALAGLVAGLGWVWAYNRGVILFAALVAYALGAWLADRPRRHLLWLSGGVLAGLAIDAALEGNVWAQHFRNALYWQRHQSIWSGPVPLSLIARNLPFYALGACTGLGGLWAIWKAWKDNSRRSQLPVFLALGVAAGGNYLAMFNRPDPPHLMFTLPWLTLLGFAAWLAFSHEVQADSWPDVWRKHRALLAVLVAVLIVDASAATGSGTTRPVLQGLGRNLLTLAHGLPSDAAIIDPKLARAALALAHGGGECTYVFDNSGAFYFLSGLRPCSSIMLPIYATAGNEHQVIADLERSAPPMVIGRSTFWTDHIDDQSVAERTPAINRWFESHYRTEQIIDGIEIRCSR